MEDVAMKTAQLLAVAMVTFSSIPFMAQHVGATTQQSASASATGNHASESAQAGAAANGSAAGAAQARRVELRPVRGELQGKLDSKTARPGDRVVLKTE